MAFHKIRTVRSRARTYRRPVPVYVVAGRIKNRDTRLPPDKSPFSGACLRPADSVALASASVGRRHEQYRFTAVSLCEAVGYQSAGYMFGK